MAAGSGREREPQRKVHVLARREPERCTCLQEVNFAVSSASTWCQKGYSEPAGCSYGPGVHET